MATKKRHSGKGASALAKIRTRTKTLVRSGMKFRSAQKQAGREYREGSLSGTRKRHHKRSSVGAKKKRVHRRKLGATYKPVKRITHCRKVGAKRRHHRRRIGQVDTPVPYSSPAPAKKGISPLGWVAIGLGGLFLLSMLKPSVPALPVSLSPAAQNAGAMSLLQAASAAGASETALTNMVNALNATPSTQITQDNTQLASTGQLPANWSTLIGSSN